MAHSDDVFLLVRERIDTQALIAKLKAPEDGAVVVFESARIRVRSLPLVS